jgi:hypothetical protein
MGTAQSKKNLSHLSLPYIRCTHLFLLLLNSYVHTQHDHKEYDMEGVSINRCLMHPVMNCCGHLEIHN